MSALRQGLAGFLLLLASLWAQSAAACPTSRLVLRVDGMPSCVTHRTDSGRLRIENTCHATFIVEPLECPYCEIPFPQTEAGDSSWLVIDERWVSDVPLDGTPTTSRSNGKSVRTLASSK